MDDAKNIEQLALVLVNSLHLKGDPLVKTLKNDGDKARNGVLNTGLNRHLHIEQGVDVDLDVQVLLDVSCKSLFVRDLGLRQLLQHL